MWEEVIIHLSDDVQLVSLSATVSNAEEFGDWLATVRGDTQVVVSEHRPVPSASTSSREVSWPTCTQATSTRPTLASTPRSTPSCCTCCAAASAWTALPHGGAEDRVTAASAADLVVARGAVADGRRRVSPWWTRWTPRGCCPRSCSSSRGPGATVRCSSAWPPGCA
ncbi:hypothetical protein [Cellulomonas soli]